MNATLYLSQQISLPISVDGLNPPSSDIDFGLDLGKVSKWLGCNLELVDVLASTSSYVAYSVFDYEGGEPNTEAMQVLAVLTGHPFSMDDENTILFGPVLIVEA
jgi:hypothetical protein